MLLFLENRLVDRGTVRRSRGWLSIFGEYRSDQSYGTFKSHGFTLLELLAVIALIAVLAGLLLGAGRRAAEVGRIARARAELAAIAAALENYQLTQGDYPHTNSGAQLLQSLIGRRSPLNAVTTGRALIETAKFTTAELRDPYADTTAVLVDPWGRPYLYAYKSQVPWSNSSYVLGSVGPDGRDSGALLSGGLVDPAPAENADNLSSDR